MCDSWRDDITGAARGEFTGEELVKVCDGLAHYPSFKHLSLTGGDPQRWGGLDGFLNQYSMRRSEERWDFNLQINTALTQDLTDQQKFLWRQTLSDVRISLDAAVVKTYQRIRGDKFNTPADIVTRIKKLAHPRTHVLMCVSDANIDEVGALIDLLTCVSDYVRKVSFLPVIGPRGRRGEEFWEQYLQLAALWRGEQVVPFETSFADSVPATRAFLLTPEAESVECHTGQSTFHIKADGYWYPCCLVGGEALKTYRSMRKGNVKHEPVDAIVSRLQATGPEKHYCGDKPCREICQYKQLAINVAGTDAAKTNLTMP
jgi:MoaA/NifB/PqqE/SkfB family radical SAM enzyme